MSDSPDTPPSSTDVLLYQTEDGTFRLDVPTDGETVWLSQQQMADLFGKAKSTINEHIKNIYAEGELEEASSMQKFGNSEFQQKPTNYYNLDVILAVAYRVRSPRGVQFRRWASTVLKEYLQKGFVMDDERLKNPDGRPDHFDEMLGRIREIRASEKRFYQKVRELFALSTDYDKSDRETHLFFATVQNQLIYAVTSKTAAELITERAKPEDPYFGLLT
jgi:hypothetical protein